jgi:hypothetical protein
MERFFMTRASALAYMIKLRGTMADEIAGRTVADANFRLDGLDVLERLILDVRAGRIIEFHLDLPTKISVAITD